MDAKELQRDKVYTKKKDNNRYKTSKKIFRHSTRTVTDISLFSIWFFSNTDFVDGVDAKM